MKLLHTSDWHLGHLLYGYERTEEHTAFLEQLAGIIRAEKPDAMLLCGDVFHYSNPSAASQRLYTDALLAMHEAHPSMPIIVTAGNHDSSAKLEISTNLWKYAGVTVIGRAGMRDGQPDLERHILEIKDGNGQLQAYVAAIPHVYPQNFPAMQEDLPREERQKAFIQALLDKVEERNHAGVPVILSAHMAVADGNIAPGDLQGGMEYTGLGDMGHGYDYLALGHIHCPHTFQSGKARYCGSPVPMSFEENYPHSVTIAEIERHGSMPSVRAIPIHNPWPLRVVPPKAASFDEALDLLAGMPPEEKMYVQLHVRILDTPPAYCMEKANEATRGKQCRFCRFKWEHAAREKADEETLLPEQGLHACSPMEVAALYYKDKYGTDMDAAMQDMMKEALRELQTEND